MKELEKRYWRQQAWNDVVCWVVGHKWKNVGRHKTNITEVECDALYDANEYKRFSENPYWINNASWEGRCVRCRWRVETWEAMREPFYTRLVDIVRSLWWHIKCFVKEIPVEYHRASSVKHFVLLMVCSAVMVVYQIGHQISFEFGVPSVFMFPVDKISYMLFELEDKLIKQGKITDF